MTPSEDLYTRARHQPEALALADRSVRLSWRDVAERTARTSNALLSLGLPAGGRLAVLGHNSVATLLTYAAGARAGVGTILLNHHLTTDEIDYIMRDGGARAIWASPECRARAASLASAHRIPLLADTEDPWRALVADAPSDPPSTALGATTDLIYTSGTTGRPKGVEFPNTAGSTVADRLDQMRQHHMAGLGPHLAVGPLYHAGPHGAVGLLLTGNSVVVAPRFEAEFVLDTIEDDAIATSIMVPTHLIRMLSLPEERRRSTDVASLRMISVTGSTCPIPVMRAMIDWFGPVFLEAYGASESGIVARITSQEWLEHEGSVGRVSAPFEALVVDDRGAPCPSGRDGVLYFVDHTGRGIRYYNDPEKTAAAHLTPGTFTLGDVGHVDRDGYLFITGRVTDMVISGGVNIYPAECERILSHHPEVRDVALFGVPDDEMGERLVGLVSLNSAATTPEELIEFCRQSIAGYKVPRHLAVVTEVPRSPMGKIDKGAARESYLQMAGLMPRTRTSGTPDGPPPSEETPPWPG